MGENDGISIPSQFTPQQLRIIRFDEKVLEAIKYIHDRENSLSPYPTPGGIRTIEQYARFEFSRLANYFIFKKNEVKKIDDLFNTLTVDFLGESPDGYLNTIWEIYKNISILQSLTMNKIKISGIGINGILEEALLSEKNDNSD